VLQERLAVIEAEAAEIERQQRDETRMKKEQMEITARRLNEPKSDSQVVCEELSVMTNSSLTDVVQEIFFNMTNRLYLSNLQVVWKIFIHYNKL